MNTGCCAAELVSRAVTFRFLSLLLSVDPLCIRVFKWLTSYLCMTN